MLYAVSTNIEYGSSFPAGLNLEETMEICAKKEEDILRAMYEWGCDVSGTLERLGEDTALYTELMREAAEDESFDRLGQELTARRLTAAFETAHRMKGFLSTMGLTEMTDTAKKISDKLRNADEDGLFALYESLMLSREKLRAILSEECK